MKRRWVILAGTALVALLLTVTLAVVGERRATLVAGAVAAVAAVAAVGVALASMTTDRRTSRGSFRASGTGKATAKAGGVAISGIETSNLPSVRDVYVEQTGEADALGGKAITGFEEK